MLFKILAFLSFSGLLNAYAGSAEVLAIYAKLKPFRTYFMISDVREPKNRFNVYVREPGTDLRQFSLDADSVKEAMDVPRDIFMKTKIFGGYVIWPGDDLLAKDNAFPDIKAAILGRVKKEFPKASTVVVTYGGRFGLIEITEVIPTSPEGDPRERYAVFSRSSYRYSELGMVPDEYGISKYGGRSALVLSRTDLSNVPKFVDYSLPPGLEGKSLLMVGDPKAPEAHIKAIQAIWPDFAKSVLSSVRAIQDKSYRNPLPAILKRQGSAFLPSVYSQFLELELEVFARLKQPVEGHYGETKKFPFRLPTASVVNGKAEAVQAWPEMNLQFKISLSLEGSGALDVFAMANGDSCEMRWEMRSATARKSDLILYRDKTPVVEFMYSLESSERIVLPGHGPYGAIEIYPRTSVAPSIVIDCNDFAAD